MPTSEQAALLIGAVDSLTKSVDTLAANDAIRDRDIKRGNRRDKWLAVSVTLDIILSVIVLFLGSGVLGNQDRLDQVQATQQADTAINGSALCAFIGIFIQLEPNLQKSPNYTDQQKANQAAFFGTMHKTSDTLRCTQ